MHKVDSCKRFLHVGTVAWPGAAKLTFIDLPSRWLFAVCQTDYGWVVDAFSVDDDFVGDPKIASQTILKT